ncbi:chromatin modification-related protein EAF1 B-like isoform X1 [Iris pallida]|uniref:Chromatin modification-related protein EAF1 B-like isoform X1 n=1 Tax=Iris pallida TaxID=29817 RepID=A0AAX6F253_IRIPA|nr:chromatin modification-related protein EAF1 B-like isoform X1 [Iris pallida]
MGDVVGCRKTSPRLAAIVKAQTELRQEFDAREKQKRELEFLEKGGNPLDFKLGRADFVGRQSASSPRGDSVESSANIAGSLLLFGRERNAKRVANLEGSLILRHGVKGQAAYARRNRSRKGRDGHSKRPSVPSLPEPLEARPEEHGVSSVSNSKPASPRVACYNHQDMEIDGEDASTEMIKDVVQEGERKVDDLAANINANTEQVANCADSTSSGLVGKGEASIHQEASENFEGVSSSKRNEDVTIPDKDMSGENGSITRRETNKVHGDKIDDIIGVADDDKLATVKRVDSSSNEDPKELPLVQGASENNDVGEKSQLIGVDAPITRTGEFESSLSYLNKSVVKIEHEVELSDMSNEISPLSKNENKKASGEIVTKSERKPSNSLGDSSHSINKVGAVTSTLVLPTCEPSSTSLCKSGATTTTAVQHYATSNEKLAKKVGEDAILKQARIIEANLKRAVELPMHYISLEKRMKCHWDFVLEEMAWMANDFMQERLWKTTVAAHICHQVASTSQRKSEQKIACQKQRNIARTLVISVMNFWHSADRARTNIEATSGMNGECTSDILKSCKMNGPEDERDQDGKYVEAKNRCLNPAIQAYAVRFIKYDNGTFDHPVLVEAPSTPDRIHDTGVVDMSWEDQLSEESFFYTVAPGSMQAYREAVESQWVKNHKKMSNSVHPEDCDTSVCDPFPDGTREYAYEEEEDETSSYYLPGAFEVSSSSKFTMKKRKNSQRKSNDAQICDGSSNWSYDPCLESTSANQGMIFVGKRPSNSLNVCSVPTKRVRTAARQRVVSPFSAGVSGSLQVTSKTDVSSEDTNCFQDDQISMHGGSQPRKNMEVESTVDFEKYLPSDGNELSPKYSKKKKPKHGDYRMNITDSGVLIISGKGSLLDQRLKVDSMIQHEQRDHVKKRQEGQHLESNGNIGMYGQHVAKKPKLLKQLSEPSPDVIMLAAGSMPSPVASQMSNMSNQNKVIKIIANRDRGNKNKATKMAVGQSGPGIPWTNFEDQALVVLVHDMGPNWELVSDAINGTLQLKCIFRKPKDCKERHKYLMDKGACDGADSAEDSGSSQPYPSTLPGIPKARGSARQLFQRLQGPIEEDVLRTHFEKIILLGQQLHSCRSQKDKQEQKQIIPVHNSHLVLPQTCPNGSVLMPLDLCDAIPSSSDVLTLGYQGSHTAGVASHSEQGSVSPVLSASGANNVLQGSSGIVLSSNLPSPSTPMKASARDLQRYCMPRTNSLPVDDHRRMQYSQMLSSRNVHQSSMSAPGALPVGVDQGDCMLPGANGVGMSGRTIPMSGFQVPPGRLNMVSTGSMLTGSEVGMPNSVNVHPTTVPCSVNPMMRPRDALQMLQPSQNTEDHRQMMMQVSQGNAQAVPPFSSISAPFATATSLSLVQSYRAQQPQQSQQMPQQAHMLGHPNHPQIQGTNQSGAQQQAHAILLAKERQHQQRMLPQQPYTTSSSMSPMQNSSQFQQQTQTSSSVTQTLSQHNKQHIARNMQSSSGVSNPMLKQRQRPQAQQQQPRQHQQKQLLQQQAKHMKVSGRGTMMGHQNVPVNTSQISGLSEGTRKQVSEKPLMQQGPSYVSGNTGLDPALTESSNYNKVLSRPPSQSSKRRPPLQSSSVTCNQGSSQVSTNDTLVAPQQSPLPTSLPLASPPPQQQFQMNQNMQRMMLQQNRPLTSDYKMQVSADPVEVNQMVPASPLPQCEDAASSASATSFASQWKPEPSYDKCTPAPTTHLAGSPQENLAGDTSVPHSNDELVQRQFTGNALLHGHGVGGQWPLQEQSQQQQQQEHQQQVQHRQTAQGTSYEKPSNSGPG